MSFSEQARDRLARISMIVMAVVLFYFIAYGIHQQERAAAAGKKRDQAISALAGTQKGIVTKLTEVFTQVLLLQASGKAPPDADIAKITESLKGYVDPKLIQQAVEAAKAAVAGQTGPKGDTGATGKTGATGQTGASATTSNTGQGTSTSTTKPPTTTTSSTKTSTTTTTKPCTVNLLAVVKLGC